MKQTRRERNNDLVAKAQAGDRTAVEALLRENEALIVKIANRYQPHLRHCDWDDLMQVGRLGMVRAIELFDPARGGAFSTFATLWVRQKMIRLLNKDKMIHLPSHIQENPASADRYGVDYAVCKFSLDYELKYRKDKVGEEAEHIHTGDIIAAPDNVEAEVIGDTSPELLAIHEAFARCKFDPITRHCFVLHYGLEGREAMSQVDIAREVGLTKQAVSMRILRAQKMIRRRLGIEEEQEEAEALAGGRQP